MKERFKLGDFVAKVAKALHIPHCRNCEKRRQVLNELQDAGLKETLKKLKRCCDE